MDFTLREFENNALVMSRHVYLIRKKHRIAFPACQAMLDVLVSEKPLISHFYIGIRPVNL